MPNLFPELDEKPASAEVGNLFPELEQPEPAAPQSASLVDIARQGFALQGQALRRIFGAAGRVPLALVETARPAAELYAPTLADVEAAFEEGLAQPLRNLIADIGETEPRFRIGEKEVSQLPPEKRPEYIRANKLKLGLRAALETIEPFAPTTPKRAAELAAGTKLAGAATRYGLLAAAKVAPRKVLAGLMPLGRGGPEAAEGMLNRAAFKFFEKVVGAEELGGVPVAKIEAFKDFFAENAVRRILGFGPAGRPRIIRRPSEVVSPERPAGEAPPSPPPPPAPEPSVAPERAPITAAPPPVEAPAPPRVPVAAPAAAPAAPTEPSVGNLFPEAEEPAPVAEEPATELEPPAEEPAVPVEAPTRDIGTREDFEHVQAAIESGQFKPSDEERLFLAKVEGFWRFNPDAATGTLEPDGSIAPVEAPPMPEEVLPEEASADLDAEVAGVDPGTIPQADFERRFPGLPPEVHARMVESSAKAFKPVPKEVLEEQPGLERALAEEEEAARELESTEQAAYPVLSAIRQAGGIEPKSAKTYRGELENALALNIVRKKGMTVPELAEKLASEGVIPEYSEEVLFQALDKEARKRAGELRGEVSEKQVAYGSQDPDVVADKLANSADQLQFDFNAAALPSSGLQGRLKKSGFVDFRGTKVTNVRQVAEMAAMFRSPKIEHFQVIFLRGDEVLAHQVITSHLPAAVSIPTRFRERIRSAAQRLGATKVYFAHNHPSGDHHASMEDRLLTYKFAQSLEDTRSGRYVVEVAGHIVTDDKEFGFIESDGSWRPMTFLKPKQKLARTEGKPVDSPQDVAAAATQHINDVGGIARDFAQNKRIAVVFAENRLRALAVETLRADADVQEYIRGRARNLGAKAAFVVTSGGWRPKSPAKYPSEVMDVIAMGPRGHVFSMATERPKEFKDAVEAPELNKIIASDGWYRVQEEDVQYTAGEAQALAIIKGIKPGQELTVRRAILDQAAKGGKVPAGRKVRFMAVDQDTGRFLVQPLDVLALDGGDLYVTAEPQAFAETFEAAPKPSPAGAVKKAIQEATGLKHPEDPRQELTEMALLRLRLAAEEKAARRGAKFAARQAAREERAKILETLRREQAYSDDIKNRIIDFVEKRLPPAARGKFLRTVKAAKTGRHLASAFVRASSMAQELERKDLVADIVTLAKRAAAAPSVAVEYKTRIKDLLARFTARRPSPETLERLRATQEHIARAEARGEDVEMPGAVLDELAKLTQRPLGDLPAWELERILENLRTLVHLGRTSLRVRRSLYALQREAIAREVLPALTPIERKFQPIRRPGEKLSLEDQLHNYIARATTFSQDVGLSILPMDVVFDLLDGGKGFTGPVWRRFKAALDADFGRFLQERDALVTPVRELATQLGLRETNFERIGIHAIRVQRGGRQHLQEGLGMTNAQIDGVTLSPAENRFYLVLREAIESLYPRTKRLMAELYNQPLGKEANYFPFQTDFDAMSEAEVWERMADAYGPRRFSKTVEKGFTKRRLRGARQGIRLDAMAIFERHVDDALYLLNIQRHLNLLTDVARSPQFSGRAGEVGQLLVRQWLSVMARRGGVESGRRIAAIDVLRRNLGNAALGFRLSSIFIQPTSLFDGAAKIGASYIGLGLRDVLGSRDARAFLLKHSGELRNRIGDDPAYTELSLDRYMRRAQRAGFAALQLFDGLSAMTALAGAYRRALDARRLSWDPAGAVVPEAMAEAELVLRRTQASPFFKDQALIMSAGAVTGNYSVNRALLQFKTFLLNRASLAYDAYRLGVAQGKPADTAWAMAYLLMATVAETGIRRGTNWLIGARLVGLGLAAVPEEDRDSFAQDFTRNLLQQVPFLGDFVQVGVYKSSPVPMLQPFEALPGAAVSLIRARDSAAGARAAIRAMEAVAALAGVPGSGQAADLVLAAIRRRTLPFPHGGELEDLMAAAKRGDLTTDETARLRELRRLEALHRRYGQAYRAALDRGDMKVAAKWATEYSDALKK